MFDHRRELPFYYSICRRTRGELNHTVQNIFATFGDSVFFDHTGVGLWAMVHLVVSNSGSYHYKTSDVHFADRMPRGSMPRFEATQSISPREVPISISSLSLKSHKVARKLWRLRHSRNAPQHLLKKLETCRIDAVACPSPVAL